MTVAWWTSLLLSWLPFFILITTWIVVSLVTIVVRRLVPNNNRRTIELQESQMMEMQRTNALLERIAVAQEKRAAPPAQNSN